jgi:soluble lytic murein transglycosylase-like protein
MTSAKTATAVFAIGCVWACAAAARADVLEIGVQGAVTTYAAPAVFTSEGVRPIVQAAPAASVRPPTAAPAEVSRLIGEAARRYALPASLVEAVAWQESRFRHQAVSPKNAVGVMQLTAGTARDLGVDRFDLVQNIHGGAAYLSQMMRRYGGSVPLALAAYNAGPGAVDRWRGVPAYRETQGYVAAIMSRLPQAPVPAAQFVLSLAQ